MTHDLEVFLGQAAAQSVADETLRGAVCSAILSLSEAACQIAEMAARNGIGALSLGTLAGAQNEDGDAQKQLDVMADQVITKALLQSGVGVYFSEEQATPVQLHEAAMIGVACDPLDGSSNIDTNLTIGTIFSVFALRDCENDLPPIGRKQIAAGIFVYGPQTALLLSFGDEVMAFACDKEGVFQRQQWQVSIARQSDEFAINTANASFWPAPIQRYIHEKTYGDKAGTSNMRWLGSLVADAYRIFRRGGVFLYSEDSRAGYETGRLRLIYEANPLALLVEAAGGAASTGTNAILDEPVTSLHQRVPLIFGSADEVTTIKHFIATIS